MIYCPQDNSFQMELTNQLANTHQFYHLGVKIPLKTVKKYMKQRKDGDEGMIMIAQPVNNKNKTSNSIQKQQQQYKLGAQMLKQILSPDDYQLYENNHSSLFEEWQKFKFLKLNDIDDVFQQQEKQKLSQYFSQFRNQDQILKLESQQLQYFIQKWRNLFKYTNHKYSNQL